MYARTLRFMLLAFVSGLPVSLLPAQFSVPQSYTLAFSSGLALEAMSANSVAGAKVSLFGPRQLVDLTVAPPAGHSEAVRARHWFDPVAHKACTLDVIQNTCSWIAHNAADKPTKYDPIAPLPSANALASLNKIFARRGNVNGTAAKLPESSSDRGRSSTWVAENDNCPVKAEITLPGAQPVAMLEVKQLRFEKPPAAPLVPPANRSVQAQGEWTADTMHIYFEATIEAPGSGQVNLKTGDATVTCGSHRTNPSCYRSPGQEPQAFLPISNRQTKFTKEL